MRPTTLALAMILLPALAEAACFADYKAKRDNPLRLHYGVVKLSDGACPSQGDAAAQMHPDHLW